MLKRLCAIVLALTALTACGDDATDPSATGSATPSGAITVYSGRSEELVGPLFEKFKQSTGIQVNARYGDTAELAAQILEEGDNSPADVFFAQDAGALGSVAGAGRFSKIERAVLDRVDAKFRAKDDFWVGASGRARVLAYNPDLVEQSRLPASVEDLTQPVWKDKVGWAPTNGSFQAFVTAFRQLKGDDAARAWLQAMKRNGAKTFPGNTEIVEAISKEEIPVGLVNHYYSFNFRKENPNAKVQPHFFEGGDPGGLINVAGVGVLNTSKNAAAAARFVDYLLSADAQRYFVDETSEYPLIQGVSPLAELPALSSLEPPALDLSELADLETTLKMLQEVGLL